MPKITLLLIILYFTVLALKNDFKKALFTNFRQLNSFSLNIGTAKSYLIIFYKN
jgi:hypothetical protein